MSTVEKMRVRVRLPAQHRPLVLIIPENVTFTELKARACAKLQVAGCTDLLLGSSAGCAQPEQEARTAPKLEGVDEVSPEDTLIVVPLNTEEGASSAQVGANGDSTATDGAGGEQNDEASDVTVGDLGSYHGDGDDDGGEDDEGGDDDEEQDDEDDEEDDEDDEEDEEDDDYDEDDDEVDDDDEDEDEGEEDADSADVRCTGEQDRESVLRRRFAKAQAEGRLIDLDVSDDDADESYVEGNRSEGRGGQPKRKRRRRSPNAARKPSLEAVLEEADVTASRAAAATATTSEADKEARVLIERIRKLLTTGLHPATPEHEAQTAMRLADRLLQRHQLTQADVLNSSDEALQGGSARVHLRMTKDGKPAKTKEWMQDVASAMCSNFEVSCYFQSWHRCADTRCDFVFYGVEANAALAAFAFAAAFNRCVALSAEHVVPCGEFAQRKHQGTTTTRSAGAYTLAARATYLSGLASGLRAGVRERKNEERRTAEAELAAARAESASGEAQQPFSESTDVPAETELDRLEREEAKRSALVVRLQTVADKFIQEQSITVVEDGRKYKQSEYRHASFVQGKTDGKNIDVNQRTLTANDA